MNIIFLTMSNIEDVEVHGIYADLMRKFCCKHCKQYVQTIF